MTQERINEQSDEQLLISVIEGDHSAFKILFYKYYKPLVHYALIRIHSLETSRDLVQELFYRVWLNRKNLDAGKSIKAYLYKSLTNQIINQVNLSSSRARGLDDMEEGKQLSKVNEIEFKLDFKTALERLPEKIKSVYILSRLEGYKYAEIAEICSISVKAVEKRMSRAFTLLKKTFEKNY